MTDEPINLPGMSDDELLAFQRSLLLHLDRPCTSAVTLIVQLAAACLLMEIDQVMRDRELEVLSI